MCLPAPHRVFADILWEAPPYCYLPGHRWHHRDGGVTSLLESGRRPYSVLWLSWQHSSRKTEWHRITAGWGWKSMRPRGLHRRCGRIYERVAHHCPAEINVPVSYFFLWYYYGGRCWAVLFQPDDSGSLGSSLVPCWWRWGWGCGQFLLWCLFSLAFIFYTFSLLLYCPLPGPLAKEIRLFLRFMSISFSGVSRLLTSSPSSLECTRQKEKAENLPKWLVTILPSLQSSYLCFIRNIQGVLLYLMGGIGKSTSTLPF